MPTVGGLASDGVIRVSKWRHPRLQEERKILPTLSEAHISALLAQRPTGGTQTRCHGAAFLMLDCGSAFRKCSGCGTRMPTGISSYSGCMDKGGRDRQVPISLEMSRTLWR